MSATAGRGILLGRPGIGALQVSPGFWASLPILLCLCPVGAAAIQTVLVLRALTGVCAHGNGAEVMPCLLPVLTCTSLIQVLLVVPLLG